MAKKIKKIMSELRNSRLLELILAIVVTILIMLLPLILMIGILVAVRTIRNY